MIIYTVMNSNTHVYLYVKKYVVAWTLVKIGFGHSRQLKSIMRYREKNRISPTF
jgi:hypothetical protein